MLERARTRVEFRENDFSFGCFFAKTTLLDGAVAPEVQTTGYQPYYVRAYEMEPTGFSPPQDLSPDGIAVSSGSVGTTPEPPAKTSRVEGGAVATSGRVPVACAVPQPHVVIHRNDRTRTRDERSQAAVSVSSNNSARAELILPETSLGNAERDSRQRKRRWSWTGRLLPVPPSGRPLGL